MFKLKLAVIFISCLLVSLAFAADPNPAPPQPTLPPLPSLSISTRHFRTRRSTLAPTFTSTPAASGQTANPIPADQVVMEYRQWTPVLERNHPSRNHGNASTAGGATPAQQKIGDYWKACSNVDALNKAGLRDLQPELDRIARIKTKAELAEQIAHQHKSLPAAWAQDDNQTDVILFGFGSQPDFR